MKASEGPAREYEEGNPPPVSTTTTSVAGLAPVDVGPEGHLVWRSLRDAWLAHRTVANQDTHVKGARAWNASRYLPVFVADDDGDPFLSFAKH